jgi:hypothetical protein
MSVRTMLLACLLTLIRMQARPRAIPSIVNPFTAAIGCSLLNEVYLINATRFSVI